MHEHNNLSALKQRLSNVSKDLKDQGRYAQSLKEKGVECAVLLPLVENLLGFDPLDDIEYETSSSKRNDQRFDFLISGKFLIEAKSLDMKNNEMKKQISNYILHNDNINYGVLSNGFDYSFFLQKSFIKKNVTQDLTIPIKNDVLHVFTVSIDSPYFYDIMALFHKTTYETHFEEIAKYVQSRYDRGKKWKITGDNEVNDHLKELIDMSIDVKAGDLLKQIQNGDLFPGQELIYENDLIKIKVSVRDDGRVLLEKNMAQIKNFNKALQSDFAPMVKLVQESWLYEDQIFDSPLDIIREAKGKKKLYNQEQYYFQPLKTVA